MNGRRRPAPEPLDVNVVSAVILGTAIWFVAFLVLLPFHARLDDAGHTGWIWTSLAGWTLGLVGIVVARAQRVARDATERGTRHAAERGTRHAAEREDGDRAFGRAGGGPSDEPSAGEHGAASQED